MPKFTDSVYAFLAFTHQTADYTVLRERMKAAESRIETSTEESNKIDQQGVDVLKDLQEQTSEGRKLAAMLDVSKSKPMQELAADWNGHVRNLAELDTPIVLEKLVGAATNDQTNQETVAALQKISSDFDQVTQALRQEKDDALEELEEAKTSIEDKEEELLRMGAKEATLEAAAKAANSKKTRLREERSQLTAARNNALQERDVALAERDAEAEALVEAHRKKEGLKQWAQGEMTKLEGKVETAEKAVRESEEARRAKEDENAATFERKRTGLQSTIDSLSSELETIQGQAESGKSEHQAKLGELAAAVNEIAKLKADVEAANAKNTDLEAEIEPLRTELKAEIDGQAAAWVEVEQEKQRADDAEEALEEQKERCDDALERKEAEKTRADDERGRADDAIEEIEEQKTRANDAEERMNDAEAKVVEEQTRADNEKGRADDTGAKLEDEIQRANEAEFNAAKEKARADDLQRKLEAERNRADNAVKRADDADESMEEAEERIKEAEERIEEAEERIEEEEQRTRDAETRVGEETTRADEAASQIEGLETRASKAEQDFSSEKTRSTNAEQAQTARIAELEAQLNSETTRADQATENLNNEKIRAKGTEQQQNARITELAGQVQSETTRADAAVNERDRHSRKITDLEGDVQTWRAAAARVEDVELEYFEEQEACNTLRSELQALEADKSELQTAKDTADAELQKERDNKSTEDEQTKAKIDQLERGVASKHKLVTNLEGRINAAVSEVDTSTSLFGAELTVRPSLESAMGAVLSFVSRIEQTARDAHAVASRYTKQTSPPFPSAALVASMPPTEVIETVVEVLHELDALVVSLREKADDNTQCLALFAETAIRILTVNAYKHIDGHQLYSMKAAWWKEKAEELASIKPAEERTTLLQLCLEEDYLAGESKVLTPDDVQAEKEELSSKLKQLGRALGDEVQIEETEGGVYEDEGDGEGASEYARDEHDEDLEQMETQKTPPSKNPMLEPSPTPKPKRQTAGPAHTQVSALSQSRPHRTKSAGTDASAEEDRVLNMERMKSLLVRCITHIDVEAEGAVEMLKEVTMALAAQDIGTLAAQGGTNGALARGIADAEEMMQKVVPARAKSREL